MLNFIKKLFGANTPVTTVTEVEVTAPSSVKTTLEFHEEIRAQVDAVKAKAGKPAKQATAKKPAAKKAPAKATAKKAPAKKKSK